MNKIILIGCLVQNPKVVASEGKKTAAYFRVAVNRKYGQEGDQMQITSAVLHLEPKQSF